MPIDLEQVVVLGERLDHPEGVAWDPTTGTLIAGGEAGQIYRVDPSTGKHREIANTGGNILALAVDGKGVIYACDTVHQAVMRIDGAGRVDVYSHGPKEAPFILPNYLVFDATGTLYVSDSGSWGAANGRLVRVPTDRTAVLWSRSTPHFTNGLALSQDGRWLYVAESEVPRVSRLAVGVAGSAGERQEWISLPKTVPDGLALVADGSLFIACYRPDRIYHLDHDRVLHTVVDDWPALKFAAPTNLAFFGPQLERAAAACLAGEWLVAFDPGCHGQPLNYPQW